MLFYNIMVEKYRENFVWFSCIKLYKVWTLHFFSKISFFFTCFVVILNNQILLIWVRNVGKLNASKMLSKFSNGHFWGIVFLNVLPKRLYLNIYCKLSPFKCYTFSIMNIKYYEHQRKFVRNHCLKYADS